jgi:transposase
MIVLRPLLFYLVRLQDGQVMSMQPLPWPEPDPVVAAAVEAKYPGRRPRPLAVQVRDRLGEWLHDEDFAAVFGIRGRPGWSPSRLALVTVLQRAENMGDRAAAEAVRMRLDWQYLLGLSLDAPGFDHSVLPEFRAKVAGGGMEQVPMDALLERLAADGLVKPGGKQRTDSTHVTAAVAALSRLELAGETVRAAVEALACAHPGWTADVLDVRGWTRKYGTPVTDWHPPASKKKQDELAVTYAEDGYGLLRAVYDKRSPAWLAEIPAVETLRRVLVQNYTLVVHADGREVIRRREKSVREGGDGLPPGEQRIASPYDTDARWGAKREEFWLGYKLHVTETCDDAPACGCAGEAGGHEEDCRAGAFPNLVTHVATTDATVTDNAMTSVINDALAAKGLAPARHYEDSGYLSAALVVQEARRHGIALIGPLLADTSAQARAGNGYSRADFTVDYDAGQVTCPQGSKSVSWSRCARKGKDAIVATFSPGDCGPCPARELCTRSRTRRRQLTLPPRDLAGAQAAARAAEKTRSFQADYARRAGVEGTMHQAASHGARRARYRGLAKTSLDHAFMAVALNLLRLSAYWNGQPLDRQRTSHLARLELSLAALPNKPPGSSEHRR